MDPRHVEMLTHRLLCYFGSMGSPRSQVFTLRAINLQVMMNVYSASERDGLGAALAGLVASGALLQVSATDYELTDDGMLRVRAVKPVSRSPRRRGGSSTAALLGALSHRPAPEAVTK